MNKIENKFTFASAIFNLIASILCFICLVWFLIELLTGHVFGLPSDGWEGLGKAIVMVLLIISLIPLTIFSILHLVSFFSIKNTAYFVKDRLAVNNVYSNPKRLIPFILPFIGYVIFGVLIVINAINNKEYNQLIFAGGIFLFALVHLLLPLPDVIKATKN